VTFASLGLPEPITRGVHAVGYDTPTPIQLKAIPMILPGRDLVAAAQTGSGKTAAFVLPILSRLLDGHRALRALVLVPTRELAAQVEENARLYARYAGVRVGAVFGGVPIGPQERMLRGQGVELLIATPGRLLDLNGRQSVALDEVEILVLDEADRMVDMGFAPDLRRILKLLPKQRQTLMFSATMPAELNKVAHEALHNPQRLEITPKSKPVESIVQAFYPVPRHLKVDLLDAILRRSERGSVIVFTRTKHGADRLARQLDRRGHDIAVLHGDRSQGQRERALESFRSGRVETLIATDIASRGIDIDDITHVVNFDVPRAPDDYMHRIGRTGRMNASGDALTLITPEDRKEVDAIERFMNLKVERIELEHFDYSRRPTPKSHDSGDEDRERRGGRGHRRTGTGGGGSTRGSHASHRTGTSSSSSTHARAGAHGKTTGGNHGGSHASRTSPGQGITRGSSAASSHGRRPKAATATRRGRKRI
jgi:ATP-dependent RNA helicase RhlE